MRLVLDAALFTAPSQDETLVLLQIFTMIALNRYPYDILLTDPGYQPGGLNGPIDTWLAAHPTVANAFRGVLTKGLLANSANPSGGSPLDDSQKPRRWHLEGALKVRVERRQTSDWPNRVLTLMDAAELLREPVYLVLENARTEFNFLTFLAGPTQAKTLRELKASARIHVYGGGSGECKKWIEELKKVGPTPETWRKVLRAWVLFDKDAGGSDATHLSEKTKDLIALCEDVSLMYGGGISWICLLRREVESYVPNNGLSHEASQKQQQLVDFVQKVTAWRADPRYAPWAWALDLKEGLLGDLRSDLPKADRKSLKDGKISLIASMLKAPFAGLPPSDVSILERGFDDILGKAIRADTPRTWASDLPAEYDRGPADQAPRLSLVQSLFDRM